MNGGPGPGPVAPPPHPSGARAPALAPGAAPRHVAVVMDGNGRWANARGLPRIEGHRAGERALVEVVAGAVEAGVEWVSAYAFSTENWKRSPAEVRFLMGYSRDVLRSRRDLFDAWGVRVVWSGGSRRLWRSVVRELVEAENQTRSNTVCTLNLCVNYGGRAEVAAAARELGRLDPEKITERALGRAIALGAGEDRAPSGFTRPPKPTMPDVDLFLRTSGEQRTSNFLLWQAAYAELVFVDELWPDVDRTVLWRALEAYAARDRRFGAAQDHPA